MLSHIQAVVGNSSEKITSATSSSRTNSATGNLDAGIYLIFAIMLMHHIFNLKIFCTESLINPCAFDSDGHLMCLLLLSQQLLGTYCDLLKEMQIFCY